MSSANGCGGTSNVKEVYPHAYETVSAAREGVTRYMTFYNQSRSQRALDERTPDRVY